MTLIELSCKFLPREHDCNTRRLWTVEDVCWVGLVRESYLPKLYGVAKPEFVDVICNDKGTARRTSFILMYINRRGKPTLEALQLRSLIAVLWWTQPAAHCSRSGYRGELDPFDEVRGCRQEIVSSKAAEA
jgi:hypothetical protein